ncbi:hypothetical protein FGIG_04376, partial [Fasciola gigantica]
MASIFLATTIDPSEKYASAQAFLHQMTTCLLFALNNDFFLRCWSFRLPTGMCAHMFLGLTKSRVFSRS